MGLREAPDEALMSEVAGGRAESLEPLVQRYVGPLLTFLSRMCADRHRAEELFQETFLSVWVHRGQYRRSAAFRPWLYKIALNKCREVQRRRVLRLSPVDEGEGLRYGGASPVEAAVLTEQAQMVERAVEALPEKQRAVVVMRVWGGMEYGEIATALGVAEGTARSTMHDALGAIRRKLEGCG